ncbi:MAG: adenylosuccinate lyase [Bradymonadaceae bacterium]|nr:adenylosuccinate lyase [Lujinxingiaceae bacterium]
MIPRYTRAVMDEIWSEERKLRVWFDVELAAVEGWAREGVVPGEASAYIQKHAVLNAARVMEIEAVTRHDVAAFVQSLEESVGEEHGRWIHFGLTSSDVLDTALAVLMREAADVLIADVDALMEVIRRRAFEFQDTPMIGRSHGIHAEATTFGAVLAMWYDEMVRNRQRLERARETIAYGKISGAVGTFANVPPAVEAYVCQKLGLRCEAAASQVVSRDRHAEFFTALALVASSLEKFSVQIRHMQRTEVLEAEERFHAGQKGSSAMPHKRNPILSENVTGLARTVRGYVMPALENVALWHERDISHSSVERVIVPDATSLLDYALVRMTRILDELVVYPENMLKNFQRTRGLPFSQAVLLALVKSGLSRQNAYQMVQRLAMQAWDEELDFEALVRSDRPIGQHLAQAEIDACFDLELALQHIPSIFRRVFGTVQ